jgi:hypothetical protein
MWWGPTRRAVPALRLSGKRPRPAGPLRFASSNARRERCLRRFVTTGRGSVSHLRWRHGQSGACRVRALRRARRAYVLRVRRGGHHGARRISRSALCALQRARLVALPEVPWRLGRLSDMRRHRARRGAVSRYEEARRRVVIRLRAVRRRTLEPSNPRTLEPSNLRTFEPSNLRTLAPFPLDLRCRWCYLSRTVCAIKITV